MKRFPKTAILTAAGYVEVVTFAEFTRDIGGMEVLFRVTSPTVKSIAGLVLTHVGSTRRVADVQWRDIAMTRDSQFVNNYEKAGVRVLNRTLKDVGVEKFAKAVRRYTDY